MNGKHLGCVESNGQAAAKQPTKKRNTPPLSSTHYTHTQTLLVEKASRDRTRGCCSALIVCWPVCWLSGKATRQPKQPRCDAMRLTWSVRPIENSRVRAKGKQIAQCWVGREGGKTTNGKRPNPKPRARSRVGALFSPKEGRNYAERWVVLQGRDVLFPIRQIQCPTIFVPSIHIEAGVLKGKGGTPPTMLHHLVH